MEQPAHTSDYQGSITAVLEITRKATGEKETVTLVMPVKKAPSQDDNQPEEKK